MTNSQTKKRYHFIGIGGAGMGTLATLLLAKGESVSGSDVREGGMTRDLRKKGAQIFIGHNENNVTGADCVVVSSAISDDNAEMVAARRLDIPILRRAKLLARLMKYQTGITVAGAHGKTTTTSMISHLLIAAGLNPTTAIGGVVKGTSQHAALGSGKYFVAEVDESDGSFLCFHPRYSIITNIDFEHVDYYHNWDNILNTYRQFVRQTYKEGCLIFCGDDLRLREIATESPSAKMSFGLGRDNDLRAENLQMKSRITSFDCILSGENLGVIHLPLIGQHNVLNALACAALGFHLSLDFKVIQESLKTYQGVNRRFQFKGSVNGIVLIDDYGHHPTEIEATLNAAQSVKGKRLFTVFQPHRYSRTKFLMNEFIQSLSLSDELVVTDIYAASETAIKGVSAQQLVKGLEEAKACSVTYVKRDKIVDYLLKHAQAGDLVLTLGAGDITQAGEQFLAELKARTGSHLEQITEKG